jgi:hypothetical protein
MLGTRGCCAQRTCRRPATQPLNLSARTLLDGHAVAALAVSRRSCHVGTALASLSLAHPSTSTSSSQRSSIVAAATSASGVAGTPAGKDLLVVGPGVLGAVLAKEWLATVPGGTATGLTNTGNSHERLVQCTAASHACVNDALLLAVACPLPPPHTHRATRPAV